MMLHKPDYFDRCRKLIVQSVSGALVNRGVSRLVTYLGSKLNVSPADGVIVKVYRAFRCARSVPDVCFHLGYQGIRLPRTLRKRLAGSPLHRAWHHGYYGAGLLKINERARYASAFDHDR